MFFIHHDGPKAMQHLWGIHPSRIKSRINLPGEAWAKTYLVLDFSAKVLKSASNSDRTLAKA